MTIQKVSNQEVVISGTWNSASAYNGVIIDIRDLSSNINSDLLDLRLNGITQANITKGGMINTTSSVSALGTIFATTLSAASYANLPVSSRVAGSNTQVQFNANGAFGAHLGLTYTSSTQTLDVGSQINTTTLTVNDIFGQATPTSNINFVGNTHSIEITPDPGQGDGLVGVLGGFRATTYYNLPISSLSGLADVSSPLNPSNGKVLTWSGTKWIASSVAAGGGGGTPGGSNTQVQFNNNGSFSGVSGFTYDNSTQTLSITTVSATNYTNLPASIVPNYFGILNAMVKGLVSP